jgi:hypothetical protein
VDGRAVRCGGGRGYAHQSRLFPSSEGALRAYEDDRYSGDRRLSRVVHWPRKVAPIVRRECRANDCQDAAEQTVVDPQAVHVGVWERSELNEWHGVWLRSDFVADQLDGPRRDESCN